MNSIKLNKVKIDVGSEKIQRAGVSRSKQESWGPSADDRAGRYVS